jgi:ABC-type uncharacterized transport system auxiliary subunit
MKCLDFSVKTLFIFSVAAMLSGCSLLAPGYKQVNYYDIGKPAEECTESFSITVQPFFNNSPSSMKFYYREDNYSIVTDDYNKWTQNPEGMLTRYLNSYFSKETESNAAVRTAEKDYLLSGTISSFEIDLSKKEVCFAVDYDIKNTDSNKSVKKDYFMTKIPFTENKAEIFAAAMSEAEKRFAERIKADLLKMKK